MKLNPFAFLSKLATMKKTMMGTLLVFFILVVASLGATTYYYMQYQKIKKDPQLIAKEEEKAVTDSIKQYMNLPGDEQPTLATIVDKEKLAGQDFFKNAANGDKILIYTKAQKAILYRPSTGRVIEFAPLIIGAQGAEGTEGESAAPSATSTPTPSASPST